MINEKRKIRRDILAKRDKLDEKSRALLSEKITQQFRGLDEINRSNSFFIYLNFGSEVVTRPIINHLLDLGKRVSVPRTYRQKRAMDAVIVGKRFKTVAGAYGIMEPDSSCIACLKPGDIDCIVLPGAVFDRNGGRIGYGGGYYDTFLKNCKKGVLTIGMAFSFQLQESVPQEDHDVRIKVVVTENEIVRCKSK